MFKNLEKPPSITVTPFGNGDIRDSKWIDWRGGGWYTFSLSRVFCKISRGKYFAFHSFISLSLSLSSPYTIVFSSRCFSLLQIKRRTGVYSRSSTRSLDRGEKNRRKNREKGEGRRKRGTPPSSSFERERTILLSSLFPLLSHLPRVESRFI